MSATGIWEARPGGADGRLRVSREVVLLLTICLLDTISSALLFHLNLAVEANPLLRPAAEAGVVPFVSVKTLSFLPGVVFLEIYRRFHPGFVLPMVRLASGLYLAIYGALVVRQFV